MRGRIVSAVGGGVIANLFTAQATALVIALIALTISCVVAWRQWQLEKRQDERAAEQLERAKEQTQRLGDELRGD